VEVTDEARGELDLTPGSVIWLAVKATEIGVEPDAPPGRGST
jgi:hypothetical protein